MDKPKRIFFCVLVFSTSFAISHFHKDDSSCSSNSDCNYPNGDCLSNKCVCRLYYDGDKCTEDWRNDKSWLNTFIVYSVCEIVFQLICMVLASWQLYITIKYSKNGNWAPWSITTFMLVLIIIAAFIRIVSFSVDPHHYRDIIHPIADEFLFTIPVLMWLGMGFMLFLYWLELQSLTGIQELLFISKYRKIFVIFITTCAVILLPLAIWKFITNNPLSGTLYNGFFIIVLFALIFLLSGSGGNLIRVIRITYRTLSTAAGMQTFLSQLLRYIIALDIIMIISIVTLVLYALLGAQTERWSYVILHWFIRTEEFAMIMASLWFIRKKKPAPKASGESESRLPTRQWSASINRSQEETITNHSAVEMSTREEEIDQDVVVTS